MNSLPLVSVIIPSYKTARTLAEAIESALHQTHSNIEVIVINDGSPDETDEAVQPYLHKIVYIKQENRGLSAARNAAFRASKGEFICFLDADDILLPDKFTRQLELFEKEPDLGIVISGYIDVEADGKTEIRTVEKHWHRDALDHLLNHEVFPPHVALIRRNVLESSGLFPENIVTLEFQEDWQLWLSFALDGVQFSSVVVPTCKYRRSNGSFSASDPLRHNDGAKRVVEWLCNDPRASKLRKDVDRLSAIVDLERIARLYSLGRIDEASRVFAATIAKWPGFWREPANMQRLYTMTSSCNKSQLSGLQRTRAFEKAIILEMLPRLFEASQQLNSHGEKFTRRSNSLLATSLLAMSDIGYNSCSHTIRRQATWNALKHSPKSALSPEGRASFLRGIIGPRFVQTLKSLGRK